MNDLEKRLKESLTAVRDSYAERREEDRIEARTRFIERYRFRRRLWTTGSVVVAGAALVASVMFTGGRFDLFADRSPESDVAGKLPRGVVSAVRTGSEPVDSGIRLGQVWVANEGDSNVVHVDPELDRVVAEIPLDGPPQEVDVGQENIWVAGFGRVTAIDPGTDEVIGYAEVGEVGDSISVSVGEGYVWAIVQEERLLRIDPATYEWELVEGTAAPVDVAARDGSVWVLDREKGLMRFDPASTEAAGRPAETFEGRSADISAGGGVVWVASKTDDTVIRFIADGSDPPGSFQVKGTYIDMAVSESVVWVLSRSNGKALLTALDSTTARALGASLELDGDPVEVSSGGGDVWVTARSAGAIFRIDPAAIAL